MAVAEHSSSEYGAVDLRLSHELRVVGGLRGLLRGDCFSDWFQHSQADPDRWWRVILTRSRSPDARFQDGMGHWPLELLLQLASGAERDGRFRQMPRDGGIDAERQNYCNLNRYARNGKMTERSEFSQTSYTLKTVDEAKIVLQTRGEATLSEASFVTVLNNKFDMLGFLDTVLPVKVGEAFVDMTSLDQAGADGVAFLSLSFTFEYRSSTSHRLRNCKNKDG